MKTTGTRSAASAAFGIITVLLALLVTVGTAVVGHLGSQAAWEKVMTPTPTPTASASVSPAATPPTPSQSPSASGIGFSMTEVAQHRDASSCWTAIGGQVYDLTIWVDQHPGGRDKILSLCGKDGTAAFTLQHHGQSAPQNTLAQYVLGPLR